MLALVVVTTSDLRSDSGRKLTLKNDRRSGIRVQHLRRAKHTTTFAIEPASCACGSNVRVRALIHLLSVELFGHSIVLADFPVMKSIRGLGMTDKACYADVLASKFDYKNNTLRSRTAPRLHRAPSRAYTVSTTLSFRRM